MGSGRRRFLANAGGLVSASVVVACKSKSGDAQGGEKEPTLDELPEPARKTVEKIRARLKSLDIPDATFARWAQAWDARKEKKLKPPKRAGEKHVKQFLLSTDFFQNGMDESKPLKFVALYDPYLSPCYNPLRRTG